MSARRAPPRNNNTVSDTTSQGYASHRIYANVMLNNKSAGKWMVDTGADVQIVNQQKARELGLITTNPPETLNLMGVGGNSSTPVIPVFMRIENAVGFQTKVAVVSTAFNLLAVRDVSRVFNISITASGTNLTPKSGVSAAEAINTLPPPIAIPFNHNSGLTPIPISPEMMKLGVFGFIMLVALAGMS